MAFFPIRYTKLRRDLVKNIIGRNVTLLKTNRDLLMLLDYNSLVDHSIAIKGGFEDVQIDKLMLMASHASKSLGKDYIFLDIGAYNGLYSMVAAGQNNAKRIIAFEPEGVNRAQLHAQLFLNNLVRKVEVLPIALSNTDGTAFIPFSENKSDGNRGGAGISETERIDDAQEVQTVKLDTNFDFSGELIVAKVDVEGHELSVVRGGTNMLTQNHCIVQIECFNDGRRRDDLRQELKGMGYFEVCDLYPDIFFSNIDEIKNQSL